MNARRIETILMENGTLTLRSLSFQAGDAVEVIILKSRILGQEEGHTSDLGSNSYPLRGKQPYYYDDPTEPVALKDWEVLQ